MKPIILSSPEVQVVRDERKTQIRRIIKPQPNGGRLSPYMLAHIAGKARYKANDTLYVRETWRPTGISSKPYAYRADNEDMLLHSERGGIIKVKYKYKPSTHMPREAARIFLRVINVRAERIQDIKYEEVSAELGSEFPEMSDDYTRRGIKRNQLKLFHRLWDDTYDKRGYGWDVNPWVWVYTLELACPDGLNPGSAPV